MPYLCPNKLYTRICSIWIANRYNSGLKMLNLGTFHGKYDIYKFIENLPFMSQNLSYLDPYDIQTHTRHSKGPFGHDLAFFT